MVALFADAQRRQGQVLVEAGLADELDGLQFEVGDAGEFEEQGVAFFGGVLLRGFEVGGTGPVLQEGVELIEHLVAGGAGEAVDVGNQAGIKAGGFLQVAHPTGALQAGEFGGVCGERDVLGEFPVEGVVGKVEIAGRAGAAVGAREGGAGGLGVAVAETDGAGGAGEVDAGDAGVSEGLQFAGIRDAVLIEVAPDLNVGVLGIGIAEDAIVVAVEVGECGKAVGGFLAVGQEGVDAEEFVAVVDAAVAVFVENEQGIIAFDPAGAGLDAVAVVVEEGLGGSGDADGFDAVAVEVQGERVAGWGRGTGLVVEVGEFGVEVADCARDATKEVAPVFNTLECKLDTGFRQIRPRTTYLNLLKSRSGRIKLPRN